MTQKITHIILLPDFISWCPFTNRSSIGTTNSPSWATDDAAWKLECGNESNTGDSWLSYPSTANEIHSKNSSTSVNPINQSDPNEYNTRKFTVCADIEPPTMPKIPPPKPKTKDNARKPHIPIPHPPYLLASRSGWWSTRLHVPTPLHHTSKNSLTSL